VKSEKGEVRTRSVGAFGAVPRLFLSQRRGGRKARKGEEGETKEQLTINN